MSFVFKLPKKIDVDFETKLRWLDALSSPSFFWDTKKLKETWLKAEFCDLSYWAQVETEITAFILWQCLSDELEILALATQPQQQGQGLMRQLFKFWLPQVANLGVRIIYLEVHAANIVARSFYESLGFEAYAQRRAYYSDGCDAFLYRLALRSPFMAH